ncbi:MAG TPA: hypothetical protein VFZ10_09910 [Geminicoccaceae bacterium]
MTGYLQRLLDGTLPATAPASLAPVLKSTSPVFEQNQLLGLPGFRAGDAAAETMALAPGAPGPQEGNASLPSPEIPWHDSRSVTPTSSWGAQVGPAIKADPSPSAVRAADASAALPQGRSVTELGPVTPGAEIVRAAVARETVAGPVPGRAAGIRATRAPRDPLVTPARTELAVAKARPLGTPEATFEPSPQETAAAPEILTDGRTRALDGGTPRALEPIEHAGIPSPRTALEPNERAPDASPLPSVLEPRARPDFGGVAPEAEQAEPDPLQARPRITIGRLTVEVVADQAPAANATRTPRTAAAASMIGPLGNRRARRRLFALSRL